MGLLTVIAGPVRAATNLVLNGDFGTGDYSDWGLPGDTSEDYIFSDGNTYSAALTTSFDEGGLTQTLATTVGQTDTVSFLLTGDGATPNSFSASLGGTTLLTLTNVPDTMPAGTVYTFSYTPSASSSLLSFDYRDDPGYLYLTDVAVTPVVASPEPTSLGIAAVSAAGLLVRRRRLID